MKRNSLLTMALAVLAAVMGLFLWLDEKRAGKSRQLEKEDWQAILTADQAEKLNRVVLSAAGQRMVFVFDEDYWTWFMKEPADGPLDMIYAEDFLEKLKQLKREKIVELEPEDLTKYQLDPPAAKITCKFKDDDQPLQILIGKLNFTSTNLFAKLEDEPAVFLISTDLMKFLVSEPEVWRAKSLVFRRPEDLVSMETRIEDPILREELPSVLETTMVYQGQKKGPARWMIVKPFLRPADGRRLEFLMTRLNRYAGPKIIDVPDGDLSRFGLDAPRARVILKFIDGTSEEIRIGAWEEETGRIYAQNSLRPEVVTIDPDLVVALLRPPLESRSLLAGMEGRTVFRLRMEYPRQPDQNFELLHEQGPIFQFDFDPQKKSARQKLGRLLAPYRHMDVKYIYYQPPYPRENFGLDPPQFLLQAYDEDGHLALDIAAGDTVFTENQFFTYFEDRKQNSVVMLPGDIYSQTPWTREKLEISPAQVERIKQRGERSRDAQRR